MVASPLATFDRRSLWSPFAPRKSGWQCWLQPTRPGRATSDPELPRDTRKRPSIGITQIVRCVMQPHLMYHQFPMTRLGEARAACALELSRSERRPWADRMLGECFDPKGELLISAHCRPHWSQAGAVVFVTFRLHDSIPREVLIRWDREKQEWLRQQSGSRCQRPILAA